MIKNEERAATSPVRKSYAKPLLTKGPQLAAIAAEPCQVSNCN